MGCGISKGSIHPKLDFTLQLTGVPLYDDIFLPLERPLSIVHQCSKELRKTQKHFFKETGVSSHLRDPRILDGFVSMLMCYSASGNGSLESVGFRLMTVPPYIDVDGSLLDEEQRVIPGVWNDLVRIATTLSSQLSPLLPLLKTAAASNASTSHSDAPNHITKTIEEYKLEDLEATRLIRTVLNNHGKICQAPVLLEEAISTAEQIAKFLTRVGEEFTAVKAVVEEVGRQAYEKRTFTPSELVVTYWTFIEEKKRIREATKVSKHSSRII